MTDTGPTHSPSHDPAARRIGGIIRQHIAVTTLIRCTAD